MDTFTVGSLVTLKRDCLANRAGTVGVVYDIYERFWDRAGGLGISVIFPNGHHHGFSADEQRWFLEYVGDSTDRQVANYRFTSVLVLMRHFAEGRFTDAFAEGGARLRDHSLAS